MNSEWLGHYVNLVTWGKYTGSTVLQLPCTLERDKVGPSSPRSVCWAAVIRGGLSTPQSAGVVCREAEPGISCSVHSLDSSLLFQRHSRVYGRVHLTSAVLLVQSLSVEVAQPLQEEGQECSSNEHRPGAFQQSPLPTGQSLSPPHNESSFLRRLPNRTFILKKPKTAGGREVPRGWSWP